MANLRVVRGQSLTEAMQTCGLVGDSWRPWETVARCLDGLSLDRDQQARFEQCTGRTRPLTEPPAEAWLICGRRSGKSRFAGPL